MTTVPSKFSISTFLKEGMLQTKKQSSRRIHRRKCKNSLITTRNITRRSFLAKKYWLDPVNIRRRLLTLKKARAKLKHIKKIRYGRVFIRTTRTNTFLTLATPKWKTKPKKKNKKKQYRVRMTSSAGILLYKGKKKSSPLARQEVAKSFAEKLRAKDYRLIDVIFVKKFGRNYRLVIKGLMSKAFLMIRLFSIRRIHGHGSIRAKKARRK